MCRLIEVVIQLPDINYLVAIIIPQIVERVRAGFRSHKTLDYDYRITQLRNLKKLLEENEQEIHAALKADLNKVQLLLLALSVVNL